MREDLVFNEVGVLSVEPPVKYVNLEEFYEYFVLSFQNSKTREILYDSFVRYMTCLRAFVKVNGVLINGSFVTNTLDPNDIDFSVAFDGLSYHRARPEIRKNIDILLNHSSEFVRNLKCYPYKSFKCYPEWHVLNSITLKKFREAVAFWQKSRGNIRKGILFLKFRRGE